MFDKFVVFIFCIIPFKKRTQGDKKLYITDDLYASSGAVFSGAVCDFFFYFKIFKKILIFFLK